MNVMIRAIGSKMRINNKRSIVSEDIEKETEVYIEKKIRCFLRTIDTTKKKLDVCFMTTGYRKYGNARRVSTWGSNNDNSAKFLEPRLSFSLFFRNQF